MIPGGAMAVEATRPRLEPSWLEVLEAEVR